MQRRLPNTFYNLTTMVGAALAIVSLGLIVLLWLLDLLSAVKHPYMGLITFIALPAVLIFGLLLVLLGIIRTRRRERAGTVTPLPRLDLNNPQHRRAALLFTFGTVMFIVLSGFGSFQAYEYTDSVRFCGLVCHKVMEPEYTAYQDSPHARVACVECHIGSGAGAFVQSKISGSYQVYSVLFHKYSRPIPTPVRSLRPAKETCEQCHWPRHFYSAKLRSQTYFLSDKDNTRSHVDLLMKIGGGEAAGTAAGIHAHMYLDNKVSYISTDKGRNDIPYVVSTDSSGKQTVFRSTDVQITDAQLAKGEHRTVDCIDCHNRPSHRYNHPAVSVNRSMDQGIISPTLPEVKRVAVESLEGKYASRAAADAGINKAIRDFYQTTYPDVAKGRAGDIDKAIAEIENIYHHNYFPSMNVSWKGYPDHIGHMYSDGCFRCHDGKHVSSDGRVISKSCNTCHTILSETAGKSGGVTSLKGVPFQHPGGMGESWKEMKCTACHAQQT